MLRASLNSVEKIKVSYHEERRMSLRVSIQIIKNLWNLDRCQKTTEVRLVIRRPTASSNKKFYSCKGRISYSTRYARLALYILWRIRGWTCSYADVTKCSSYFWFDIAAVINVPVDIDLIPHIQMIGLAGASRKLVNKHLVLETEYITLLTTLVSYIS